MPQIKVYDNQINPSGPVNAPQADPEAFGAGIGRAVQGFGQNVGNLGEVIAQRQAQEDTSNVHAQIAQATMELDGNLSKLHQQGMVNHDQFMQDVDDRLGQIQENIQTNHGQQAFKMASAQAKLLLSQTAQKMQADQAGVEAVQNFKVGATARSAMVMNNPNAFSTALSMQNQEIDDLVKTRGLPFDKAEALKTQSADDLAHGALRGIINIDPAKAEEELASGKWDQFLGENTQHRLESEITRAKSAKLIEEERQRKLEERAAQEKEESAKEQGLQMLYSNGLSTKWILNNNDLSESAKEHMLQLVEKRQDERVKSDNSTQRMLVDEIHKSDTDPTKKIHSQDDLVPYYTSGQINSEGLKMLRGEMVGKGTQEGENESIQKKAVIDAAKASILKTNAFGIPDPNAADNFAAWQYDALTKIQKAKDNGSFTPDFYDPKSPKYIGNNFDQYQRSPEEKMKAIADRMTPRKTAPPNTTEMVLPDGSTSFIPNANVETAKKRGAKLKSEKSSK